MHTSIANQTTLRSRSSAPQPWRRVFLAVILWLYILPADAQEQRESERRVGEVESSTSLDPDPNGRDEDRHTRAEIDSQYESLLDRALDAYDSQDYARARTLFEQAFAIRPNARVLRGMGISALRLERFTLARRELKRALSDSRQPLTLTQRQGVEELLSWMQQNLGSIDLRVQPANAQVVLNGEPTAERALVVKPGAHRLQVRADDFVPHERTIDIAAGQAATLQIALQEHRAAVLEPPPTRAASASALDVGVAPPGRPMGEADAQPADGGTSVLERWWFWTAVGVVVVGGVAATVVLTSREPSRSFEAGGLGGVIMPLELSP